MKKPGCTLTATHYAIADRRDELLELFVSFIEKSRSEPGCLEYNLQISKDDPNIFVFYENWESREALDVHMALPYQQAWFKRQSELLSKPAELRFFDFVGTLA